jgi:putative membrane protein
LLIRVIVTAEFYIGKTMRYLIWVLRAALFLMMLGFAVKNDQPVVLRYFFGYEWEASLVVILLVFFAIGAAVGILAVLGKIIRQRREIAALKNELQLKNKLDAVSI